jgi:hypothetical protein
VFAAAAEQGNDVILPRRSWFEHDRRGALKGGRVSVKWEMVHHIASTARMNRKRYEGYLNASVSQGEARNGRRTNPLLPFGGIQPLMTAQQTHRPDT